MFINISKGMPVTFNITRNGTFEKVHKRDVGDYCATWPGWKMRELRRAYYAAVSYADHELGRVLEELKALGLKKDTIVVFLGDHGWHLGEHAKWAKKTNFEIATR